MKNKYSFMLRKEDVVREWLHYDADGVVLGRLAAEIALFADKSSIDEELTRLASHLNLIRDTLIKDEPIGRQLDFIVQEINREVNTICSKSSNTEITGNALEMKNTVEKIREQVQNIE